MFNAPPPFKQHWVYDDPSGVPERNPYPRAWPRRVPRSRPRVTTVRSRLRLTHREA